MAAVPAIKTGTTTQQSGLPALESNPQAYATRKRAALQNIVAPRTSSTAQLLANVQPNTPTFIAHIQGHCSHSGHDRCQFRLQLPSPRHGAGCLDQLDLARCQRMQQGRRLGDSTPWLVRWLACRVSDLHQFLYMSPTSRSTLLHCLCGNARHAHHWHTYLSRRVDRFRAGDRHQQWNSSGARHLLGTGGSCHRCDVWETHWWLGLSTRLLQLRRR